MLDTYVAIALRDGDRATEDRLRPLGDDLCMSVVTRIELEGGLLSSSPDAAERRVRLAAILTVVPIVDLGAAAIDAYSAIVAVTGFSRRKILDRMIAAQALVLDATLITRNAGDFQDVPGLKLLAW